MDETGNDRPRVVLVADDELSLRRLVAATIESDRYTVVEAADGDTAWDLLVRYQPVLALLDVQMPGRTGLELTRAIRADDSLRHSRVILLTARAKEADLQAGYEAGADLYLTKPFSPLALLQAVDQLLGEE